MKPTLVILAAGMASRYGSMKQTEGFGPGGETIMDYSIFSALNAGFGKVVFIIRESFAETFKESFEKKLKGKIETVYVYQEPDSFVKPEFISADRTKPWGTGHALLCAKAHVQETFAVINADDFYGNDAFCKAYQFLTDDKKQDDYALIGYALTDTLSDHGSVSRGVCASDENNILIDISERTKIERKEDGIFFEQGSESFMLPEETKVSMNFWCFRPEIFDITEQLFSEFPEQNTDHPTAEFLLTHVARHLIRKYGGKINVLETSGQWFGVTYKEDDASVKESLRDLIKNGDYPEMLWLQTGADTEINSSHV